MVLTLILNKTAYNIFYKVIQKWFSIRTPCLYRHSLLDIFDWENWKTDAIWQAGDIRSVSANHWVWPAVLEALCSYAIRSSTFGRWRAEGEDRNYFRNNSEIILNLLRLRKDEWFVLVWFCFFSFLRCTGLFLPNRLFS